MNVPALVRKEFNLDERRIYLMGHSQGGGGARHLAEKYPETWAAVALLEAYSYSERHRTPMRISSSSRWRGGRLLVLLTCWFIMPRVRSAAVPARRFVAPDLSGLRQTKPVVVLTIG